MALKLDEQAALKLGEGGADAAAERSDTLDGDGATDTGNGRRAAGRARARR